MDSTPGPGTRPSVLNSRRDRAGYPRRTIDTGAIGLRWKADGPKRDERGKRLFAASEARTCRFPPRSLSSEVRLLGARNVGVAVVVIVLMDVVGTHGFRRSIRSRHIGQGRGPRGREDALVLDRQMQLQELAP